MASLTRLKFKPIRLSPGAFPRSCRFDRRTRCAARLQFPYRLHGREGLRDDRLVAPRRQAGETEVAGQRHLVGNHEIPVARDAVENAVADEAEAVPDSTNSIMASSCRQGSASAMTPLAGESSINLRCAKHAASQYRAGRRDRPSPFPAPCRSIREERSRVVVAHQRLSRNLPSSMVRFGQHPRRKAFGGRGIDIVSRRVAFADLRQHVVAQP